MSLYKYKEIVQAAVFIIIALFQFIYNNNSFECLINQVETKIKKGYEVLVSSSWPRYEVKPFSN